MINITLFFIGIICVIITFFLIVKEGDKHEVLYKELLDKYHEIEDYVINMEEIIDNLEEIINSLSINKEYHRGNFEEKNESILNENVKYELKEQVNGTEETDIKEEIFKLKEKGLSNNEIAKRLSRGKREVDIIIKMKDGKID